MKQHYECVLLYVEDALAISEDGESIVRNETGRCFELNEESIGPPKKHLGGSLRKVTLEMDRKRGLSVHPNMCKQLSRMLKNTMKGTAYAKTHDNTADLLTKLPPAKEKRHRLVRIWTRRVRCNFLNSWL